MRTWVIRTVVVALFLVGAFLTYQRYTASQVKKVEIAIVKRGDLKQELTVSGQIQASEHVILRFQTSGQLTWVGVKEGDYVKKYQTVAALDQRELQKNLTKYLETYKKKAQRF